MRGTQKIGSLPGLVLASVIAGAIGAVLGALVLGLGVYFASYSDRLMPFYFAGALAGLATSIAYTFLKVWSKDQLLRQHVRSTLAVLIGTLVVWVELGSSAIGMSLGERAAMSLLWLCVGGVLLLFAGRLKT
jgi:hypothetical protein